MRRIWSRDRRVFISCRHARPVRGASSDGSSRWSRLTRILIDAPQSEVCPQSSGRSLFRAAGRFLPLVGAADQRAERSDPCHRHADRPSHYVDVLAHAANRWAKQADRTDRRSDPCHPHADRCADDADALADATDRVAESADRTDDYSVVHGMLRRVDHRDLERRFRRLQLQPELLLQGCEERGGVRIGRDRFPRRR